MNRRFPPGIVLTALVAGVLVTAAIDPSTKLCQVQNKKGRVRAEPDYLAPIVNELVYGDSLEVLNQDGGWVEARLIASARPGVPTDVSGWIHQSDLTDRTLELNGRDFSPVEFDAKVGHSAGGKGLGSGTEKKLLSMTDEISEQHFGWVDRMEQRATAVSLDEIRQFLTEGELKVGSPESEEGAP